MNIRDLTSWYTPRLPCLTRSEEFALWYQRDCPHLLEIRREGQREKLVHNIDVMTMSQNCSNYEQFWVVIRLTSGWYRTGRTYSEADTARGWLDDLYFFLESDISMVHINDLVLPRQVPGYCWHGHWALISCFRWNPDNTFLPWNRCLRSSWIDRFLLFSRDIGYSTSVNLSVSVKYKDQNLNSLTKANVVGLRSRLFHARHRSSYWTFVSVQLGPTRRKLSWAYDGSLCEVTHCNRNTSVWRSDHPSYQMMWTSHV